MKAREIRRSFLEFFAQRGHRIVSLVAAGPPPRTRRCCFTNAGMVQFKDAFHGQGPARVRAGRPRSQKCLRVSGKHNDLDNVGRTSPRHHTFFEMLGNFSFGDYFKQDAIRRSRGSC
jgi:alanyl-tRNA synthetase